MQPVISLFFAADDRHGIFGVKIVRDTRTLEAKCTPIRYPITTQNGEIFVRANSTTIVLLGQTNLLDAFARRIRKARARTFMNTNVHWSMVRAMTRNVLHKDVSNQRETQATLAREYNAILITSCFHPRWCTFGGLTTLNDQESLIYKRRRLRRQECIRRNLSSTGKSNLLCARPSRASRYLTLAGNDYCLTIISGLNQTLISQSKYALDIRDAVLCIEMLCRSDTIVHEVNKPSHKCTIVINKAGIIS